MAMKRCPVCGEKYSDTYKSCPFCEEEAALRQGEQLRRGGGRGGKRTAAGRGQQPNLLSPILIGIILLLACLLMYLLFGDKIADKLGGDKDPAPPVEDVTPPDEGVDPIAPEGVMPGGEDQEPEEPDVPEEPVAPAVDPAALPATLTVNNPDFTLKVGETYTVKVTAGSGGPFTWLSSDDGVASVDAAGKVTAISVGKVTLTVHDGAGKANVTVYVKAAGNGSTSIAPATGGDNGSGGAHKLNLTDFTMHVGDAPVQLKVSGITTAITWASKDTGIATVSGSGAVTAAAVGTTTVTASWDGQSLECIVRVSP